ncbi:hypothetical protein IAD21_00939 [Abditibacteriota bacterium]|nr:hypothetical protein IAD21_00939 [Abditibacteriota bacterium]
MNSPHSVSPSPGTVEVTLFRNLGNPFGQRQSRTWGELCALLTSCDIRSKKDGPLISPAIYKSDPIKRSNDNVAAMSGLMADCDEAFTLEELRALIEPLGVRAIIYSSHRQGQPDTKEHPDAHAPGERYRVFFPLDAPLSVANYPDVWERLNILFGGEIDASCKDPSRGFYLPSHPTGEGFVGEVFEGRLLSVDDLPPLPPEFHAPRYTPVSGGDNGTGRPGDDYNAKATNEDTAQILEAHGWKVTRSNAERWKVKRPGKTEPGVSATIGHYGPGILHVFTSNAPPFEAGKAYKPFGVLALLEHGGSFKDTAKDLGQRGFGEKMSPHVCIIKGRKRTSAYIGGENPDAVSEDEQPETSDEDERQINEGLYGIQNGRTVLMVKKEKSDANGSQDVTAKHFVCDFAAHIVEKTHAEDGGQTFLVEGLTIGGDKFSLTFPSGEITDPRKMAFKLGGVAGDGISIHAGMEKHLGPSIQAFTDRSKTIHKRSFERTGWTHDFKEFLIPGMESNNTEIHLEKALAYRVEQNDETIQNDLYLLFASHIETLTPIVICHAFLASASRPAGFQDEKFATFAVGRSGTLKTSWHQMAMSIYGDFGADDKLLKLGAGGTVNAMMNYPAAAADLPLLFDNFKPGTGTGQKDATTLVHALLEGTERKRLNRDGSHRAAREYRCWPQFTGEDTISDAASIARMLIVGASDPPSECIEALTKLQANAHRLPRIGGHWLAWLLTDKARAIIAHEAKQVGERRGYWVSYLRKKSSEMVNAMRVATSLSLCEFLWRVAKQCPILGEVFEWWEVRFREALRHCADNMTGYSAQSHEANRYLSTLRTLVIGQRAYLQEKGRDPEKNEHRTFVGWQDSNLVYLLPNAAFAAASDALRSQPNGLNGLAENTISKQLDQLGFLEKKDGAKYAPKCDVGGTEIRRPRVLVLKKTRFFDEDEDEE